MAISPIMPGFGPHPKAPKQDVSRVSSEDPAETAARQAQQRAAEVHEQAEASERASRQQMDATKQEYEKMSVIQSIQDENALETQKAKGYEAIRDLQRQQQAELRRVKAEGDKTLSQATEYYRNQEFSTRNKGEESLQQLQSQYGKQLAYEKVNGDDQTKLIHDQHQKQVEMLKGEQEAKFRSLAESSRQAYEQKKSTLTDAMETSDEKLNANYKTVADSQKQVLDNLQGRTSEQIREIRDENTAKLAAYSSRMGDPFYRMMDMGASIQDAGTHYEVKVTVPEHEQQNIAIAIKGDTVVISGHRKNEEKFEVDPGHTKGTASYQTFNESFPLLYPVDAKNITREIVGDQLTVKIPKKNEYAFYKAYQAPKPERARVERPQFPDGLQYQKPDKSKDGDENAVAPKTTGGRTLES